ncbi:hypothetical protein AB0M36_16905 [Actinoplanes sp. NPDC051346]|uniref:hypothetical protein n=1 Tax=Actinoplanes sp. NPDC051346 TaxID=3155048 RepID=UPI00342777C1
MAGTGDLMMICHDGRVVPVPSGAYLHNRPMKVPIDQVSLVRALMTAPLPDTAFVHPAPGAERSAVLVRFLGGQPSHIRHHLVVKPPASVVDKPDVQALEELGDLYDLALELPVREELKGSRRSVPIDGQGRQTTWRQATSVRLLTRAQAAARASVQDAVLTAKGPQPASVQRMEELATRAADTRDQYFVTPETSTGSTPSDALAGYVARYGLPAGMNLDDILLPAIPPTVARLTAAIGGQLTEVDPDHLVRGLSASPGSAALVSFRPVSSGPAQVGWLISRNEGLFWLEPDGTLVPVDVDPDSDDWHAVVLRDPETRVLSVNAAGRPTTMDALLVPDSTGAGDRAVNFADPKIVRRVSDAAARFDDSVYCVAAVGAIRDLVLGGAPVGRQAGTSVDDSVIDHGLWGGWGRPEGWPGLHDWGQIDTLVGAAAGRFAVVLMNRPGGAADLRGVGHAFAAVNQGGRVEWIDPGTPTKPLRVLTTEQMMAAVANRPDMTSDLRMRIHEADGTEVELPAGAFQASNVPALLLASAGEGLVDEDDTPAALNEVFGFVAAADYQGPPVGRFAGFSLPELVRSLARLAGPEDVSSPEPFSALARRIGVGTTQGGAGETTLAVRHELLDVAYLTARVFGVNRLTSARLSAMRQLTEVRVPDGGAPLTDWAGFEALVREVRGDDLPVQRSDGRRLLDLVAKSPSAGTIADLRRWWTGTPKPRPSELILEDLRAAARAGEVEPANGPTALLGPNLFGRSAPPPPPWMEGIELNDIATDQLPSFFTLLDVTKPAPSNADLRPEALQHRPDLVWRTELSDDERSWAQNPESVPEEYRLLPEALEVPLIFKTYWAGGVVPAGEGRNNLANLANALGKGEGKRGMVLVWTTIPRSVFAQAMKLPSDSGPVHLREIREFVKWTKQSGVVPVNVDEVYHAAAQMQLDAQYRMELDKLLGVGAAAASDIFRFVDLDDVGGLYTDPDNALRDDGALEWLNDLRELFEDRGFAVAAGKHGVRNSAIFMARWHPFARLFLNRLEANYARTQRELLGDGSEDATREAADMWTWPTMRSHRNSVSSRTGTENLRRVNEWGGFRVSRKLPALTQFDIGSMLSWAPAGPPLEPPRRYTEDEVSDVVQFVVATLIRELYNREGDLHLTYVAPVVAGLPDPEEGWRAALMFILERPELASRIRTVTDRLLVEGDGGVGTRVVIVDLPADMREAIGIPDLPLGEEPSGVWRFGELMRPSNGFPGLKSAAELRTDVRTVFLVGDEETDRRTLREALSATPQTPIRIATLSPTSDHLLDWLRGQLGRSTVPVFVPGIGQQAVVVRGDLAARWPDGMVGNWQPIGRGKPGGYQTVETGHLARPLTPVAPETDGPVTMGERVAAPVNWGRQLDALVSRARDERWNARQLLVQAGPLVARAIVSWPLWPAGADAADLVGDLPGPRMDRQTVTDSAGWLRWHTNQDGAGAHPLAFDDVVNRLVGIRSALDRLQSARTVDGLALRPSASPVSEPTGDLDHDYGPLEYPWMLHGSELDPAREEDVVDAAEVRGAEIRLNPAWMPLSELTMDLVAARPSANWLFAVAEDGAVFVGAQNAFTLKSEADNERLIEGFERRNPDGEGLAAVTDQGHPTVVPRITRDGRTFTAGARVSGEFKLDPVTGTWQVTDASGRYMGERENVDPDDVHRWLTNVAARIGQQLEVPVEVRKYAESRAVIDRARQLLATGDSVAMLRRLLTELRRALPSETEPMVRAELSDLFAEVGARLAKAGSDRPSATAGGSVPHPNLAADTGTLLDAILDNARRQGVALPTDVTDSASLRSHIRSRILAEQQRFTQLIRPSLGTIVADLVPPDNYADLLADFDWAPPEAMVQRWRASIESAAGHAEAARLGVSATDPESLRRLGIGIEPTYTESLVETRRQFERDVWRRRAIAEAIDAREPNTMNALGRLVADDILDAPTELLIKAFLLGHNDDLFGHNDDPNLAPAAMMLTAAIYFDYAAASLLDDVVPAIVAEALGVNVALTSGGRTLPLLPGAPPVAEAGTRDTPVPLSPQALAEMRVLANGVRKALDKLGPTGRPVDEQYCAEVMTAARTVLYPTGVAAGQTVDDSVLTGDPWSLWGRPSSWPRLDSWQAVAGLLGPNGGGRAAFVVMGRPGGLGHAFVAVRTKQGEIAWFDPTNPQRPFEVMSHAQFLAKAQPELELRARVYDANRQPVPFDGPPAAGSASTARAITAPGTGVGLAAGELEGFTRVGKAWAPGTRPERNLSGRTLATVPGVRLKVVVDVRSRVQVGESGTTYPRPGLAELAGDPVVREENWFIDEVVYDPGAALPGETGPIAEQIHEWAATMTRWIDRAGAEGLTVHQALSPDEHGYGDLIDEWVAMHGPDDEPVAQAVRDALRPNAGTVVDPSTADEPLYSPELAYEANILQHMTYGVKHAGLPTMYEQLPGFTMPDMTADSGFEDIAIALGDQIRMNTWLQQTATRIADKMTRAFVASLVPGQLSETSIEHLLQFEETKALKGAVTVALAHLFGKLYGLSTVAQHMFPGPRWSMVKDYVNALLRHPPGGVFRTLPDVARNYVMRHLAELVEQAGEAWSAADRGFASGQFGVNWLDHRFEFSPRSFTAREFLMDVFAGGSGFDIKDLYGRMSTYDIGDLLLFERRLLPVNLEMPDGSIQPSMLVTLDDTYAWVRDTVALANVANEAATAARALSEQYGGIKAAAQHFLEYPSALSEELGAVEEITAGTSALQLGAFRDGTSGDGRLLSASDPVDFTDPGVQFTVAHLAGQSDPYCVAAVAAIFDMVYKSAPVPRPPGRAHDDSVVGLGVWSGWGRPSSWPRADDWAAINNLVAAKPGRFAAVLMKRPDGVAGLHGVGHAFVAINQGGEVRWIDPGTPTKPMRVLTTKQMLAAIRAEPGMTNDLLVRVYEADRSEVEAPTGEFGTSTVAALLLSGGGYGRVGHELQTLVRVGRPIRYERQYVDGSWGEESFDDRVWQGRTLAKLHGIGMTLKVDTANVATGQSGRLYADAQLAWLSFDEVEGQPREEWFIVEVVPDAGGALDSERAVVPFTAEEQLGLTVAITLWLQAAGQRGATVTQALQPYQNGYGQLFDVWMRSPLTPALAYYADIIATQLREPRQTQINGIFRDEQLFYDSNSHPGQFTFQSTLGTGPAGVDEILRGSVPRTEGTRPAELLRIDELLATVRALADGEARAMIRSFVHMLPLSDETVDFLMGFEEALALKGMIGVALMHLLAGREKNGLYALSRHRMAELFAELPATVQEYLRTHAERIINDAGSQILSEHRQLLGELMRFDGDVAGWLDVPQRPHSFANEQARPDQSRYYTPRIFLRAAYTGTELVDLDLRRIFGGMNPMPVDRALPGQPPQELYELRWHIAPLTTASGVVNHPFVSLERAAGMLVDSLRLSRRANGIAAAATALSQAYGGLKKVVELLSLRGGDLSRLSLAPGYEWNNGVLLSANPGDGHTQVWPYQETPVGGPLFRQKPDGSVVQVWPLVPGAAPSPSGLQLGAFRDGTSDDGRLLSASALRNRSLDRSLHGVPGSRVRAGHYFPGPDDAVTSEELAAAREMPSIPGWFVVFVHGTGDGRVRVGDQLLSAWQFVEWVKRLPGAAGKKLALVSCFTGSAGIDAGFTDRARTLWGQAAMSATGIVERTPNGRWLSGDGRLPWIYYPKGLADGRLVDGDLLTAIANVTEAGPDAAIDQIIAATRRLAPPSVEVTVVDGNEVRFTARGRSATVAIDVDDAHPRPSLTLERDNLTRALHGQRRPVTVNLPASFSVDDAAAHLLELGIRAAAEHGSGTGRVGRLVVQRSVRNRFAGDSRTRQRISLSPSDHGQVGALMSVIRRLESAADADRARLERAVIDRLRTMGVLRDRSGGAHQGEALLRKLASTKAVSPATMEFLQRRFWDSRTEAGDDKVLSAIDTAVSMFMAQEKLVAAAQVDVSGDTPVLRVATLPPDRKKVTDADLVSLPIRLVDRVDDSLDTAVGLRDSELLVRKDASDAAIAVELSGVLASWAIDQVAPGTSAADRKGLQLFAEHTTVRRLYFQGRRFGWRRFSRAAKDNRFWLRYAARVTRGALDRVNDRIRELLAAGGLDAGLDEDLRQSLGQVEGVEVATPTSNLAPTSLHMYRRLVAAAGLTVQTVVAGGLADRRSGLIANSAAGGVVQSGVQAFSDRAADKILGAAEPKPQLVEAKAAEPATLYQAPPWTSPKAQLTETTPPAVANALVGLAVAGGVTGNPLNGLVALGVAVGQSIGAGALSQYVFDRPEDLAKGRFEHYYHASPDHQRNGYVEAAYYFAFELRDRLRQGGQALTDEQRAALADVRDGLDSMRGRLRTEVASKIRELHRRRALPRRLGRTVRPSKTADVTYDVVERGVTSGAPRMSHNATRGAIQQSAMQTPPEAMAHLLNSAVGLMDTTMVGAALRGLAYGAGWSPAKGIEFADSVALAAFDALDRVNRLIALIDSMLNPARPEPAGPRPADPANRPRIRKVSKRVAAARDQRDNNKAQGRPSEMPWTHQIAYKHIPALLGQSIGYAIGAGLGWLASGPLIPAVLTTGALVQIGAAAGETALRVNEPLYRQVARERAVLDQAARLPWSTDSFISALSELKNLAVEANKKITPVSVRRRSAGARLGTWVSGQTVGKTVRMTRRAARAGSWIGGLTDGADGPRALTRTPVGDQPVELTVNDRAALRTLDGLLANLDGARDPRTTARPDLTPELVTAALAVHLDTLGLRQEQPGSAPRWKAVSSALRTRYGRRVAGDADLGDLRAHRLDGESHPGWTAAIRLARDANQRVEQLWEAVDRLGPAERPKAHRFDVRSADTIQVVDRNGHEFVMKLDVGSPGGGHDATIQLAPDDLVHAILGTGRSAPHRLTVRETVLTNPEAMAAALRGAADAAAGQRVSRRTRTGELASGIGSLTIPLDVAIRPSSTGGKDGPSGDATDGAAPATAGQHPLVPAPSGTEWDDRVLALGSWLGRSREDLKRFKQWAPTMTRPVIAVNVPSGSSDGPQAMADLETALLRFARIGVHPVVLVKTTDRHTFENLRDKYRPVTIQPMAAGLDNVWQLQGPSGEAERLEKEPNERLFHWADGWPAGPTGSELPRVLADWLSLNDWPSRELYLRSHAADLLALTDGQWGGVAADEADPYRMLLDMVRDNRLSDPSAPRYTPEEPIQVHFIEPAITLEGRLPETFVIDFLTPKTSSAQRKPWYDQLLRLVAVGELTERQMVVLARNVPDGAAGPNATVFEAIEGVLEMTAEEAGQDPATNAKLIELQRQIMACRVPPWDRMTWVSRMDYFRDWLRDTGQGEHAALIELLTHTLSNC